MSMDQWPALPPNPPNFSIPEPLVWNVSDLDLLNISDRRDSHQDKTSSMVITFIYFVVCAVGLCGNSLVIYVILRYAKMKTVTNIYILNLAVADVLCMMSLPFISMQLALVHWPFGETLCRAIMTVGESETKKMVFFYVGVVVVCRSCGTLSHPKCVFHHKICIFEDVLFF